MNVDRYVEALRGDLALAAAAGGPEAERLAERITAPLESALRLVLQDALSDAAQEISRELAPGSVELRLRGRELGFAVTPAPADASVPSAATAPSTAALTSSAAGAEGGDGGTSRISFRPPDRLKAQIEEAAEREGQSVNAFLVSTLTAALAAGRPPSRAASQSPNHVVGWVS